MEEIDIENIAKTVYDSCKLKYLDVSFWHQDWSAQILQLNKSDTQIYLTVWEIELAMVCLREVLLPLYTFWCLPY